MRLLLLIPSFLLSHSSLSLCGSGEPAQASHCISSPRGAVGWDVRAELSSRARQDQQPPRVDSCRDLVIKLSAGLSVQVPDRPGSKVVESAEKQAQGHHGRDCLGDGS